MPVKRIRIYILAALTAAALLLSCCDSSGEAEPSSHIESFSGTFNNEMVLEVGQSKPGSSIKVNTPAPDSFSPEDIVFISEDTGVAKVEFDHSALKVYVYFKVTAVSEGETFVYIKAKEGNAVSDKIKVTVIGSEEEGLDIEDTLPSTQTDETPSSPPNIDSQTAQTTQFEQTSQPKPSLAETQNSPESSLSESTAYISEKPAVTATSEEAGKAIRLISITSPIVRSNTAALAIKGKPNTEYSISVYYSSGKSSASGLENKTSDGDGNVSWSWKVGGKTKAGDYKIEIKGGNDSFSTYISVTELQN